MTRIWLSLALAPVLLAADAGAAPPCAERARLLTDLQQQENRRVVAHAVTDAGNLFEIAADPAGALSVVMTFAAGISIAADGGRYVYPPGTACVVDEGAGWQVLPEAGGREVLGQGGGGAAWDRTRDFSHVKRALYR